MIFKRQLILHVAGIFIVICLLAYTLFFTQYYASTLTLFLVLVFQVTALQRHIDSTNRLLTRFLSAIKYSDFSQSFRNKRVSSSFSDLGDSMNMVVAQFRANKNDKEVQANYFTAVVEQIPVAVCSIDKDGTIILSNYAFKKLFKKSKLRDIHDLEEYGPEFTKLLGGDKAVKGQTLKVTRQQEILQLKITSTLFRSQGRQEKLVTIQDIRKELESNELESWQNLIRVMTHEIMNSVTPITSLAETADHYISEANAKLQENSNEEIKLLLTDARDALKTIEGRGQGLMRFVESYRSLSKLPTPKIKVFRLSNLFSSLENLVQAQIKKLGVDLTILVNPKILELRADAELLEQALINLVNNSLDAIADKNKPSIEIRADMLELGRIQISVIDNGSGIAKEKLGDVFVPFFTTKRGGSGIGMSIVKQIVTLNGGTITVSSEVESGTTVTMVF